MQEPFGPDDFKVEEDPEGVTTGGREIVRKTRSVVPAKEMRIV